MEFASTHDQTSSTALAQGRAKQIGRFEKALFVMGLSVFTAGLMLLPIFWLANTPTTSQASQTSVPAVLF